MGHAELSIDFLTAACRRCARLIRGAPGWAGVLLTAAALGMGAAVAQEAAAGAGDEGQRSLAALRAALEADPHDPAILVRLGERYIQLGYFSEALDVAKRLARIGTAEAAVASRLIGARALVGLRRPDEALTRLKNLTAKGEAAVQAALVEGDAWLLKGAHGNAYAAYARARRLAKNPREADLALARLALATGDLDGCRKRIAPYLEGDRPDPRALVLAAEIAKRSGRLDEALDHVDQALALSPDDVTARILRAGLLLALGRVEEAGDDVAAVRDRLPDAPISDFLEALYLVRQGRIADARTYADKAARLMPRYLPLVRLRAWLAFFEGRLEEAIALASQVEAADPNDVVAAELKAAALLRKGGVGSALRILERLDRSSRIDDRGRILLASAYMRVGRFDAALRLYERAMARFQNLPELKTQYALAQFALGEVDAARKSLTELARSGADAFRAAVMLTLIERRLGRIEAAMAAADQVERLAPRSAIGPNLKGLVALTAGDLKQARRHFDEALAHDPGFLPARRNLARVLLRMGEDEQARAEFLRVLEAEPKDGIALVSLAEIAARQGKWEEATRRLSAAIALAPREPRLRLRLIALKERAGDLEGAFKSAVAADLLLPDRRELVAAVARLALRTGRPGIAEQAYRRLVAAEPDEPTHRIGLALALLARGDDAGARRILLQADKLFADPTTPARRDLLKTLVEIEERAGNDTVALGYARELVRLFPDTKGMRSRLARLLARTGDRQGALAVAQRMHDEDPQDPGAAMLLADILMESADTSAQAQARRIYDDLITRIEDVRALAEMAAKLQDHDPGLATRAAEKALRLAPGSAALRLLAAEANWALAARGDRAAAARAAQLVGKIDESALDARQRTRLVSLRRKLGEGG